MSRKPRKVKATDRYAMPTAINPLRHLKLPPLPSKGRPPKELLEAWLAVVAQLLVRGVCDPAEASELTGVQVSTMRKWYSRVLLAYREEREHLAAYDGELWELRRESVDRVYRQVQEIALDRAQVTDSDKNRVELLRVALTSAGHRAKLYGLNAPERSEVAAQVQTQSVSVDIVVTPEALEARYELPEGALRDVGVAIAKSRNKVISE